MKISVFHMSGAGNKFSVLNGNESPFDIDQLNKLAPLLCSKNTINQYYSEGLILVRSAENGIEFQADFLNPDGSHGAMCGNGGRCAVRFALDQQIIEIPNEDICFEMAGKTYNATVTNNLISVKFPPPVRINYPTDIEIGNTSTCIGFVDVGSDHAVIDFNELHSEFAFDEFNLKDFAPVIRYHRNFGNKGANVNLFIYTDGTIRLRTYERGVEAETGACGTGSISTAIIASIKYGIKFPVKVIPTSGEELFIDIEGDLSSIKNIYLKGPAKIIDTYTVEIPDEFFN